MWLFCFRWWSERSLGAIDRFLCSDQSSPPRGHDVLAQISRRENTTPRKEESRLEKSCYGTRKSGHLLPATFCSVARQRRWRRQRRRRRIELTFHGERVLSQQFRPLGFPRRGARAHSALTLTTCLVGRATHCPSVHLSELDSFAFCLWSFIFVQPRSRRWRLLTRLNSMRAARNRPEIRAPPLFHCTTTGHFVGGLRNEEDRSARYKMAPETIVLVARRFIGSVWFSPVRSKCLRKACTSFYRRTTKR